jgi:predicted acyltransferase
MTAERTEEEAGREEVKTRDTVVSTRLLSLDAFRGLTIVLMLLVNNTAAEEITPPWVMHAPWNGGIYLADFVFPWFLFCVGMAIPFSMGSFMRRGEPVWRLYTKVLQRTALLVLLGCILDSSINRRIAFSLGVLQIIGLAYMVASFLYGLPLRIRCAAAGLMLVVYWAAIRFIPVPGNGSGVFLENQNFIYYINTTYLAEFHIKGLLSVIPTGALALIGTAYGDLLRRKDLLHGDKILRMVSTGALLVVISIIWNLDLPFNKTVWTPSYIIFMAGSGAIVLSLFYRLIDDLGWKKWAYPLIVFGSNAIVAYVVPILIKVWLLMTPFIAIQATGSAISCQKWLIGSLAGHLGNWAGGWLYTFGYIALWWIILWILYKKRWFVRV